MLLSFTLSLFCPSEVLQAAQTPKSPLTFFTFPKPFTGDRAVAQRNAIHSWILLEPRPTVILFGNATGTDSVAKELDVIHAPVVESSPTGLPYMASMMAKAALLAPARCFVFINSDIILSPEFGAVVEAVETYYSRYVMIGKRTELSGWTAAVRDRISVEAAIRSARNLGYLQKGCFIDYIAFTEGVWDEIPRFVIGRPRFDQWLVHHALLSASVAVVDASDVIAAVHQAHDYHHLRSSSTQGIIANYSAIDYMSLHRDDPDAEWNEKLAGNYTNYDKGRTENAPWKVVPCSTSCEARFCLRHHTHSQVLCHSEHTAKWRAMRDSASGSSCVLLGTGPSLNKVNWAAVRESKNIVIGVNKIYLGLERFGIRLSYYIGTNSDSLQGATRYPLNAVIKLAPYLEAGALTDAAAFALFRAFYSIPGFSFDPADGIKYTESAISVALQVAFHIGCQRVVLLGLDHEFVSPTSPTLMVHGDPNHFAANYTRHESAWQKQLNLTEGAYAIAREAFHHHRREVLDATVQGRCPIFPRNSSLYSLQTNGRKWYVYDLDFRFNYDGYVNCPHPHCKTSLWYLTGERFFYERLRRSPLRTLDPSEAALFYVPFFASALIMSRGGADWWPAINFTAARLREVLAIVMSSPQWQRNGGKDHVWYFSFDHGVCLSNSYSPRFQPPPEILPCIHISTYGNSDDPVCSRAQDVVAPPASNLTIVRIFRAELAQAKPRKDAIFFQGSIDRKSAHGDVYSNGTRQLLWRLYRNSTFWLWSKSVSPEELARDMTAVDFCACPEGFAPWTPRLVQSVLAGCIPVIISSRIVLPLTTRVPWHHFSIRIMAHQLPLMNDILKAISKQRRTEMRAEMAKYWSQLVLGPDEDPTVGVDDGFQAVLEETHKKSLSLMH